MRRWRFSANAMDAPFVPVARVVKTHGLKGEVAVKPLLDLPFDLLLEAELWAVPPIAGVSQLRLTGVRQGPKGPLLTIAGVDTLAQGRALAGATLLVRSSAVPEGWNDDEFDPIGYTVTDTVRGSLGTIMDVIYTGANDVWEIEGPFGSILIPVIDDVVHDIADDTREISVTLLPGLLDED
ncbi:MAG: 16S rRNA processing protein RimM [Actinobacteria bacterium]|nr:MAG: 16S rRNA processing protein RimM [Actinomycetota bacterium]